MVSDRPVPADVVPGAIERALDWRLFFTTPGDRLSLEYCPRQELVWEIFRGHLLDAAATRQRRAFATWTLLRQPSEEHAQPVLAVHWDREQAQLYVVRFLRLHGYETYEESPNIIQTRAVEKLARELVGSIDLRRAVAAERLGEELRTYVLLAVIGTSRLPITSPESPLPSFVLGELGYLPHRALDGQAAADLEVLFQYAANAENPELARVKALELRLRAPGGAEPAELADQWLQRWQASGQSTAECLGLLRTLFHHLALSPHTPFLETFLAWLARLSEPACLGANAVDLVSYMLVQLVRHLTAFDLVRFHQRGANYPDALFLDGLLKLLFSAVERSPELFREAGSPLTGRRRRALRQALLLRHHYAGLAVPDVPTSSGEQLHVLPATIARVPGEQIDNPALRRKRLYEQDPLAAYLQREGLRRVLADLVGDLQQPAELRELGAALYLDRPLGAWKESGEVDRTPLIAYQTFSRSMATQRLAELVDLGILSRTEQVQLQQRQRELPLHGISVSRLGFAARPAVAAIEDANQVASDVLYWRTPPGSMRRLLAAYDPRPLERQLPGPAAWLYSREERLMIRTHSLSEIRGGAPLLTAFDGQMRPQLEFGATADAGLPRYGERLGEEYLSGGLAVTAVWEHGQRRELTGLVLPAQA